MELLTTFRVVCLPLFSHLLLSRYVKYLVSGPVTQCNNTGWFGRVEAAEMKWRDGVAEFFQVSQTLVIPLNRSLLSLIEAKMCIQTRMYTILSLGKLKVPLWCLTKLPN